MNFNKSNHTAKSAELSEYPTTPPKNKSSVFQKICIKKIEIR